MTDSRQASSASINAPEETFMTLSAPDPAARTGSDAEPVDATATNSAGPGRTQPAQAAIGKKATFGDLLLGGASLTTDAVNDWLDSQAPTEGGIMASEAEPRNVLIPQSDWEALVGPLEGSQARYAAIGLAVTTQSTLERGARTMITAGDAMTAFFLKPLRSSRLLGPVRRPFNRLAEIGEGKVTQWAELGRDREARGRALTLATVDRLLDDSVDVLAEQRHVQVLVQEIVEHQSMGLSATLITEIRERCVSTDLALERPLRHLLRRPPRNALPGPDFQIKPTGNLALPRDRQLDHTLAGHYAGFASRTIALIIDLLVIVIGLAIASSLASLLVQIFQVDTFLQAIFGSPDRVVTAKAAIASLFTTLTAGAYLLLTWSLNGKSIGKAVMGLRIVDANGNYPYFWRSLRRLLGYVISAIPLFLGFAWVLVDNRRQGWDDKIAGTFVVYDWNARPDETFLKRTSVPQKDTA